MTQGYPQISDVDSMPSFSMDDMLITLNVKGAREFTKISYPIRYGRYHEIKTSEFIYQFNLNGEIKHIQGRTPDWPHPAEWLKRTISNDWIYYSAGSYNDVYDRIGEYYFPCLQYEKSPFFKQNPFDFKIIQKALTGWGEVIDRLRSYLKNALPEPLRMFIAQTVAKDGKRLEKRAEELQGLNGERITILPPDTRHVDYEVIPVIIAEGCRYHCGFCRFKTDHPFSQLGRSEILDRMKRIRSFLGSDLPNYNSLFLGQHDALRADHDLLTFSAHKAYDIFEFSHSHMKEARLFFFGSVDSLLEAEDSLFNALNRLPFLTFINIGLESGDPKTMDALKKPIRISDVKRAFYRMLEINRRYKQIEVTANFVIGKDLSENHYLSILDLARKGLDHYFSKGAIYFSPLNDAASKPELLRRFNEFKRLNRLPTFIYLTQRL